MPGGSESEPPSVVQVDDHLATYREFVTTVHPTLHATRAEARAAADHPVVYPVDALAAELTAELTAALGALLERPEHGRLLREVLLATDASSPLLPWLAVGVSLGGTPLDELDLPSEVQERASYDAAAFRARHRPMGSFPDDQELIRAWTRMRWLSRDDDVADELTRVLDALVDSQDERRTHAELLRGLTGRRVDGLGAPLDAPEVYAGTGGALGLARQALAAVDGAPIRTKVGAVVPAGPMSIRPVVTVEPSGFYSRCTAALEVLPVALRSEHHGERLERCRRAGRQQDRDRGGEAEGSAWKDLPWPEDGLRAMPLTWSHGRPVEGLAKVGYQRVDVAVEYATPPRRLDAPTAVATGATERTLVVPVWVPFTADEVPTVAAIQAAASTGDREAIARALGGHPPQHPCGCGSIAPTPWFFTLLVLGLVRKRS